MSIKPGSRLGSYEIVAKLGEGGMGEVWRATDAKLRREVALKVLPDAFTTDPDRLARFEREAQLLAQLHHANIAAIFGLEESDGVRALVMELVEGPTLAERLERGPLSLEEALPIARQITEALEAAHDKGIVHRDLKPQNVKLNVDGKVKVLDFGLAKALDPANAASGSPSPTLMNSPTLTAAGTQFGVILGTAAYMAPEQAKGLAVDRRADIWSFGCVLYEMLTGRRAFTGDTVSDTIAAILLKEPDWAALPAATPRQVATLLRRCLRRDPRERLRDIGDARFDLEEARRPESEPAPPAGRRFSLGWLAVGLAFGAALGTLAMWIARTPPRDQPTFRSLTRERGTIGAALFVPGTSEVAYSARWGTGAERLYVTRADRPAPREIPGFSGLLQSISSSGEVLGTTGTFISHAHPVGRLVSVPLSGGAERSLAEAVWSASWGAGGEASFAAGIYGGDFRLEWPPGHVVTTSREVIRMVRTRGDLLAYFSERGDTYENGVLIVAGRAGTPREIATVAGFTGLAWGPDGRELWVSTAKGGQSRVEAIDLEGHRRTLLTHAGRLEIEDVGANGRALVVIDSAQRQVFGHARGGEHDEDLGWLDAQTAVGITDDGSQVLLAHTGQWSQVEGDFYLRPMSGGPALHVGTGDTIPALSRDGKWVATTVNDPVFSLKLFPTGTGAPRLIPVAAFKSSLRFFLLPGGQQGILWGRRRPGDRFSFFRIDFDTAQVRQVEPNGAGSWYLQWPFSPDYQWLAFVAPDDAEGLAVSRIDGSDFRRIAGLSSQEAVSGWYRDSNALVVFSRNGLPASVDALDLRTGKRTSLLKILPPDPVGISGVTSVMLATDGGAYVYSVVRQLSELYLIEGLR